MARVNAASACSVGSGSVAWARSASTTASGALAILRAIIECTATQNSQPFSALAASMITWRSTGLNEDFSNWAERSKYASSAAGASARCA